MNDVHGAELTADIPLLSVEGLDKSFYATHAAADVSFTVHTGEIVSLLGENGAGKSTVIKMLAGVYKPDKGRCAAGGSGPGVSGDAQADLVRSSEPRSRRMDDRRRERGAVAGIPAALRIHQRAGRPRAGRAGAGVGRRRHRSGRPDLRSAPHRTQPPGDRSRPGERSQASGARRAHRVVAGSGCGAALHRPAPAARQRRRHDLRLASA